MKEKNPQPEILDFLPYVEVIDYKIASNQTSISQQVSRTVQKEERGLGKNCRSEAQGNIETPEE